MTGERASSTPPEPTTDANVAVRCTDVTHEYADGAPRVRSRPERTVAALRDVSLEVRAGEVVALTGPSGSGKTTLLHAMAGLVVPTSGTVELHDATLTDRSDPERTRVRREHVGFVFQGFHLLPALTARANVALPLVQLGVPRRERRRRATELLEHVDLADRVTHKPAELSGGEQQRVAIARALATEPELILADEPTGELDTETGMRVLERLVDVTDEQAVVLATHDERALTVADRVVRLVDGTVTADGR